MSLIACPECQRSISDRARTCPGCGFLAGLAAIALAAYLRSRRGHAASGADIWRWSVPAAIAPVAVFAALLTGTTIF